MNVDKQHINYQLGTILTRIDVQNRQLAELTKTISEPTKRIIALPCTDHNLRIKGLEKRKAAHKEAE